jgi:hypothetical protein
VGCRQARVRPAAIVGDLSVGAHARRRVDCRTAPGRGRSATHANGARLCQRRAPRSAGNFFAELKRQRAVMTGDAVEPPNLLFISRECDRVHHLAQPPFLMSATGDIDLAPRGERWHQNQIIWFLPSGWFLLWRWPS